MLLQIDSTKKLTEIDVELLFYSKKGKVIKLLIKITIAFRLKMKMVEFTFRLIYGLRLKTKNYTSIMDTEDMDIGNLLSDFKILTLN